MGGVRSRVGTVEDWVARGGQVALATVVATKKAAPQPAGTKMAVNEIGQVTGAVSGGCVEGAVVEVAETVIDGAIKAGATSLYGLNFDIQDRSALEEQARELAMKDAQARGEHYPSLIKSKLGDGVVINETQNSSVKPCAV